jgi:prepilin-type N-terminal cleavage/methylation domain-containing protein
MKRPAFTLVELMVSIALVLILMYGVTQVFSTTQSVVSSNQAISNATRDARSAQTVLSRDFDSFAGDGPFIIIHNEYRPAFRTRAELNGDRDYATATTPAARDNAILTRDIDGDNVEGGAGETTAPAEINERNHRIDTLSFFTRGLFKRQTGGAMPNGDSPFLANMTGTEAFVWYGHLRLANNAGALTAQQDPGQGTIGNNSANLFAASWAFGREAVLLKAESRDPNTGQLSITDNSNPPQQQIYYKGALPLSPLAVNSPATAGTFLIQSSRYDLAGIGMSDYRAKLITFLNNPANANVAWWDQLFSGSSAAAQANAGLVPTRFFASPLVTKPITPASLSQLAPMFLPGCSSIIVEYAGDFVGQDNTVYTGTSNTISPTWGDVVSVYKPTNPNAPPAAIGTDGVIDYIPVVPGPGSPAGVLPTTRIRWYGAPRNIFGTTSATGALSIPGWTAAAKSRNLTEVVPLRDLWRTLPIEAFNQTGAPFEKNVNTSIPSKPDYFGANGLPVGAEYTVAFGPLDPKPKMIRLTFTMDDPLGRTTSGVTWEMVFTLP